MKLLQETYNPKYFICDVKAQNRLVLDAYLNTHTYVTPGECLARWLCSPDSYDSEKSYNISLEVDF